MRDDDQIRSSETYCGVSIHDFQQAERIEQVVRPAIDHVYALADAPTLASYAADACNPPEARLFAAARCEAVWELAAEAREIRPDVDLAVVRAAVAGLDTMSWINPDAYGSLLDTPASGRSPGATRRDDRSRAQLERLER